MEMQVCENCQKENGPDEVYCITCGHILPVGLRAAETRGLEDSSDLKPQLRWGTAYFGDHTVLRLHMRDTGKMIETTFIEEITFGRAHKDVQPDVDLSPFDAANLGVSRQHVKLKRETATIMVQDLGSRNGTYLNGSKLVPYQPRVLRNEDELCLGRLKLRVSFMARPPSNGSLG